MDYDFGVLSNLEDSSSILNLFLSCKLVLFWLEFSSSEYDYFEVAKLHRWDFKVDLRMLVQLEQKESDDEVKSTSLTFFSRRFKRR